MLKAVGVAFSLAILCSMVLAIVYGEMAVAIALAALLCCTIGYGKLIQLEERIHMLEARSSSKASGPPGSE
jgi:hypothetical protein